MARPYAEVIGDPIEHSKSPLIHRFWLQKLGLEGDYRAYRVLPNALASYFKSRCADPNWRGCNVTAPLKAQAATLALDPLGLSKRLGAANAIFRSPLGCGIAANTDVQGVAAALGGGSGPVCMIGAGGAARAALEYLRLRKISEVRLIVRDMNKGRVALRHFGLAGEPVSFDQAATALRGARTIVNATPLGMEGMPPMPDSVLGALSESANEALVFDMVYSPLETNMLRRAKELGRNSVDGLTMLIAQAAPAFELFFGAPAPREHDEELRGLLTS